MLVEYAKLVLDSRWSSTIEDWLSPLIHRLYKLYIESCDIVYMIRSIATKGDVLLKEMKIFWMDIAMVYIGFFIASKSAYIFSSITDSLVIVSDRLSDFK